MLYKCIIIIIWRMFVFMSVVMTVWGSMGMFIVYRPLLKIVYVVSLCSGCDGCCVFFVW